MYTDADFANNRDDRISMGGYILYVDRVPITWYTFKQKSITLSTMELEYVAMAESSKELIWFKNILQNKELNLSIGSCKLFCDNQSAIEFSKSPVERAKTKHIDIKLHFIRDLVKNGNLEIEYLRNCNNPADLFTKPQVREHMENFVMKFICDFLGGQRINFNNCESSWISRCLDVHIAFHHCASFVQF
jgi:hypothetical protein